MNTIRTVSYAVIAGLFTTVLVLATPKESPAPKQVGKTEILKLRISDDGKSIVDQRGREVARFNKEFRIDTKKQTGAKAFHAGGMQTELKGCMRCWDTCVIYDSNGRCIRTTRTCQWDFDC